MNTMQTYLFISPNSLIISQIKFEILATSLFNFIRLFMLLQDDDSQLCLRMVFFLTTVTLKSMNLE